MPLPIYHSIGSPEGHQTFTIEAGRYTCQCGERFSSRESLNFHNLLKTPTAPLTQR